MTPRTCTESPGYRYGLREGPIGRPLVWVMLNPSTADRQQDDPTIRKVRGFTRRAGFGAWAVVNLHPVRATNPRDLLRAIAAGTAAGPPGADNYLRGVLDRAAAVVLAWGAHGARPALAPRVQVVLGMVAACGAPVVRVGPLLKSGQPRHPLVAAYALGLVPHRLTA